MHSASCTWLRLLPLVLLCSCKNLPSRCGRRASKLPSPSASIRGVGERGRSAPAKQFRTGIRAAGAVTPRAAAIAPVGSTGQASRPTPRRGITHHAGGHCPHCGPGTLPAFAFSEMYSEEDGLPWMPDGIKCPWPPGRIHLRRRRLEPRCAREAGLDGRRPRSGRHGRPLRHARRPDRSHGQQLRLHLCPAVRRGPAGDAARSSTKGTSGWPDVEKPVKVNIHEEKRGPKTALQPEQLVAAGRPRSGAGVPRADAGLARRCSRRGWCWRRRRSCRTKNCSSSSAASSTPARRPAWPSAWRRPIPGPINQAVQVLIDGQPAVEARGAVKPRGDVHL